MRPILHLANHIVADEARGGEHLTTELVVQVGTICNQKDSRTAELLALHQKAAQEEHCVTLSAASGPEICTAFTIPLRVKVAVSDDGVVEGGGGEILRITANNLALFLWRVREEDVVVNHLQQAVLPEEALDHCQEGVDAVHTLVCAFNFAPGVVKLIRSEECAEFAVYAITDDGKGVVFEDVRDITTVADMNLLVSVVDSGVFANGALKLKEDKRDTIDENDGIRPAVFFTLDFELVDNLEVIGFRTLVVQEVDIEIGFGDIFPTEREAIHHPVYNLPVSFIEVSADHLQLEDDAVYLGGGDAVLAIPVLEIGTQLRLE